MIKNNDSAHYVRDIDLTTVHYLSGPVGVTGAEPVGLLVVDWFDIGAKQDSLWGFNGFLSRLTGDTKAMAEAAAEGARRPGRSSTGWVGGDAVVARRGLSWPHFASHAGAAAMPTYDDACQARGGFDAFRSLADRNQPAPCPACSGASPRVFAAAPRLALLDSGTRHAMATNERSHHAPKSSADYARLRHPAGCGCCASAKSAKSACRGATLKAASSNKAFPSKRPWMISH